MVIATFNMFWSVCVINTESPKYYLMQESERGNENARKVIKKIYGTTSEADTDIIISYLRSTI